MERVRTQNKQRVRDSCNSSFHDWIDEGFAAEAEPNDDEFPKLEAVELGMGMGEKGFEVGDRMSEVRRRRLEVGTFGVDEAEWDGGNGFGESGDAGVNPRGLLVGAGES